MGSAVQRLEPRRLLEDLLSSRLGPSGFQPGWQAGTARVAATVGRALHRDHVLGVVISAEIPLRREQGDQVFEIQGHRGAKGLRPENTLSSIACALQVGVGSIECDAMLSGDGAVVLSHDGIISVPGASQRTVAVRELSLSQLRDLDVTDADQPLADGPLACSTAADHRLATLGEALTLLQVWEADTVRLDVEVKSARHSDPDWDAAHVVRQVLDEIRCHDALTRCSLRSFDVQVLDEARRSCPALARCLLVGTVSDLVPPDIALRADVKVEHIVGMAADAEAFAVAPGLSLTGRDLVEHTQAAHMAVIPWTVNDAALLRALVAMGVDGVCTDRPDLVREWLAADGIRLPAQHLTPHWDA